MPLQKLYKMNTETLQKLGLLIIHILHARVDNRKDQKQFTQNAIRKFYAGFALHHTISG